MCIRGAGSFSAALFWCWSFESARGGLKPSRRGLTSFTFLTWHLLLHTSHSPSALLQQHPSGTAPLAYSCRLGHGRYTEIAESILPNFFRETYVANRWKGFAVKLLLVVINHDWQWIKWTWKFHAILRRADPLRWYGLAGATGQDAIDWLSHSGFNAIHRDWVADQTHRAFSFEDPWTWQRIQGFHDIPNSFHLMIGIAQYAKRLNDVWDSHFARDCELIRMWMHIHVLSREIHARSGRTWDVDLSGLPDLLGLISSGNSPWTLN